MIDERFAIVAAVLNTIGCFIYFLSTLQGKTKPNRVTWFLWMLIPFIAFFAQIKQGVGLSSLFTFSNGFGPLLVLIGSFLNKKSEWEISRFDIICGALALVGVFLWYITKVGNLAILFAILADGFAAIPTLVKAYKAPETENAQTYLLGTFGAALTLFTIKQPLFAYYGYALFVFIADFSLFFFSQFKVRKYFSR